MLQVEESIGFVLPDLVLLVDADRGRIGHLRLQLLSWLTQAERKKRHLLMLEFYYCFVVDGDAHEGKEAPGGVGQCSRKGKREVADDELGLECYWL